MGKIQERSKGKSVVNPKTGEKNDFWTRTEILLTKNQKKIFYFLLAFCLLFSGLFFSPNVSDGGDDSTYIKVGLEYSKNFTGYFYQFNAPGYPLFLSLPIAIFGINIFLLKFLSIVFYGFSFYFFYKAFADRIPNIILFPVLFILAINPYLQYFSSQTYNEAFFFFFQSLVFYSFFLLYDQLSENKNLKSTIKYWLFFGFCLFSATFIKNVAIVSVGVFIIFFALQGEFRNALFSLISFGIFRGAYEAIKTMVWGSVSQFNGQGNILLQKDPYNASKGTEDLAGFIDRLLVNTQNYLGKRFWEIHGFFAKDPVVTEANKGLFSFLSKILVILLLIALVRAFLKKDKLFLLIGLYVGAMLVTTFLALQIVWDQTRIMVIMVPFILMLLFYLGNSIKTKQLGAFLFSGVILLFSVSTFITSVRSASANIKIVNSYIKGNQYAGFTPDWVNFLKMSKWCADNLPETALVASRKAPMSQIHSNGREFFPVYRVMGMNPKTQIPDADTILSVFKKNKVTHILVADLRVNPKKYTGYFVNTMHKIAHGILLKYPQKLKMVHKIGDLEGSTLYQIVY